ncbi:MAG: hypothetical protein JWR50_3476 [Mucilaginibacter sp.]|nr:hypothetical protein [Mucilaginibacter sp.]
MIDHNSPGMNPEKQQQLEQYKAAFDDLRNSINNLNKPLVTISNSINSLDKDILKVTDTIGKLNSQNDALAASNNNLKTNIKDVTSSFSSWASIIMLATKTLGGWGAALSAGLTILTVYGDGLSKWVKNILEGTTTLTALGKVMKDNAILANTLLQTKLNSAQAAQNEITGLNMLYRATQDHNLSLKQRKDAVSALKDQWPDTFKNLSDETIMAGKAAGAYKNLKEQILALSYAEAAKNKITDNAGRILENEQKIAKERTNNLKITADQAKATKALDDATLKTSDSFSDRIRKNSDGYERVISQSTDAYNKQNKLKDASDKIIYDLNTDTKLLNNQNELYYKEIEKRVKQFGVSITGNTASKTSNQSVGKTRSMATNSDVPDSTKHLEAMSISFAQTIELEKDNYDKEKALLDDQLNKKLISEQQYQEQSKQLQEKYHQNIGGSIKDFADTGLDQAWEKLQEYYKQNNEREEKEKEDRIKHIQELRDFELQTAQQVSNSAFSILQNSIKSESAAKLKQLETQKTAELNNSSLTSSQKQAISEKYKKKEAEEKTKAFKAEQRASILQAVINGALAITKVTSQAGMLGAFVIPGIIAETAIQVATIAAQKTPQYAKGGLHYKSDGKGALLPGYSRADNTNAYLRSGEAVVVSEAMRDPWARNLVSAINVAYGGRDFSMGNPGRGYAIGGIFTDGGNSNRYYNQPMNDQKDLANTIAYQMINNFPPVYVDVKDINNQQNILTQTVNRVNL